jgi:5'(3')-deoxyribonucleotidase
MKTFSSYLNEAPAPVIYCDMDQVLADLLGGVGKLYGKKFDTKTFDKFVDPRKPQIDKEHPHIFAELPMMPDAPALWKFITKHHVEILSATPTTWQPNAKADKLGWIKRMLSPSPAKIHIVRREQKKDYAKTNGVANILIDDWEKNIIEWEAAGGIVILHTSAEKTIARLKELGFK